MATYYIDAVAGNDANSGLTELLAKQTLDPLCGTLTAGDIVRMKYYAGNTYDLMTSYVGVAFTSIFFTRYVSDTDKPKMRITRGAGSTAAYVFAGVNAFHNLAIEWNFNSSSRTDAMYGTQSNLGIYKKNCKFTLNSTNASANLITRPFGMTTSHSYVIEDCEIDAANIAGYNTYFNFYFNSSACKFINNIVYNARIAPASTTALIAGVAGVTIAYNKIQAVFANTTAGVPSAVIGLYATLANCFKNTLHLSATGDGNHAAFLVSGGSAQFLGQAFDNIIYKADANGNMYDFISSGGITITNPEMLLIGNNAVYNRTALAFNITGLVENYGSSIVISGNPFLSTSPASADFLRLDTTLSAALDLIDAGYFDTYSNIGADGVDVGAGATPNAYDLRAGVTVGAVTGTLVMPAIGDVRAGVNYDVAPNAKTGLLNLPAEADVKVGVSYDNGTKTGSFDYLTLFSDPGVANVKTGVDYKYNSATNNRTGTYTAYPLLSASNVKIGVDIGDGSFGTYDGSDRWSDPGEANVLLGVAYKANSLTNNKTGTNESTNPGVTNVVAGVAYKINSTNFTGTRTAIYNLLPTNEVKINVDRGDGELGTYVAAERYSDPGASNVKTGTSYLYNASIINGSYTAYPLLALSNVKFGIDRGDGQLGTDKGESFNSVLTASQIAIGESIQNLGNTVVGSYTASERYSLLNESDVKDGVAFTYNNVDYTGSYLAYPLLALDVVKSGEDRGDGQLGTYTAEERYTLIPENKVEINFNYLYNNEEFTGSFAGGGATDYPLEEKVLYPTVYAFGLKTGKLGYYSDTNTNIAAELQANAELVIQNVLGLEFEKLKYFKDPSLNNFFNNTKQWGIRPMEVDQTNEVVGKDTNNIYFEIKLTTDFSNHEGDDLERAAELELLNYMSAIRLQLKETKFGRDPRVRIARDYRVDECSKIGDRVILCRAVIVVSYGF